MTWRFGASDQMHNEVSGKDWEIARWPPQALWNLEEQYKTGSMKHQDLTLVNSRQFLANLSRCVKPDCHWSVAYFNTADFYTEDFSTNCVPCAYVNFFRNGSGKYTFFRYILFRDMQPDVVVEASVYMLYTNERCYGYRRKSFGWIHQNFQKTFWHSPSILVCLQVFRDGFHATL